MDLFCTDLCKTNVGQKIALQPCFLCDHPVEPLPEGVFSNVPPSARSLNSQGYLLTGTGISGRYAELARNTDLEIFIIPMIHETVVIGPSVDGVYTVTLEAGQSLSFAFGATSLNDARITAGYDVTIEIGSGAAIAEATLVDAATPSTYGWNITGAGQITDSSGNASTVQNAEQISFLVTAGLLPPEALETSTITMTITAHPIAGGADLVASVEVDQTVA